MILAQEQSVIGKLESRKQVQGTLILTNNRLIFVPAQQEEELVAETTRTRRRMAELRFTDVDDLENIPSYPERLIMPLDSLEAERGHEGVIRLPSLKVKWRDGQVERKAEFIQEIIARSRKKNLNDWARVIDLLRSGKLSIQAPNSSVPPSKDSLVGRILYVLGDMQDKGVLEIEEEVETHFNLNLDPDQVEAACDSLASSGFIDKVADSSGENFYRKRSPLGEDDLSS